MSIKLSFFKEKSFHHHYYIEQQDRSDQLAEHVYEQLQRSPQKNHIVFICIGTDRSTGDAFGPLVGTIIHENSSKRMTVYGTLQNPVHALNLEETLKEIKLLHHGALVIAIDASMGRSDSVGRVTFASGPVRPGSAVKKVLPTAGDMHITGTVNVGGMMEFVILQNTRLHFVMQMAEWTAEGILKADRLLNSHSTMRRSRTCPLPVHGESLTAPTKELH
ncbi:spore protease YyaC [Geomicrobium sp. JSM 1781026]|uniref:spore protease YyaC n=2 Tax=unclassified Geomicrobium TaxID=2628951 RepID=UPI0035BF32EF